MVTKRGTNNSHGTGYEYYLDNDWNANNFDNNRLRHAIPSSITTVLAAQSAVQVIPKESARWKLVHLRQLRGLPICELHHCD